ncbi:ParB N-terminal domain-containing protein [Halomicroarcula sp. S1AR25-4]|uniref:ParB/RepB/Spo0J family partition protein n=1 Tax=Haloarcula sp. S1AR25-4 TaxID=2950538 RepID=UPI0028769E3E|nr:ParB N-terminal domain-containing protein [Halomicroarcula sp. S1AR25-4]MDS0280274.1 ParB N-terminal domain-containing protein [Halomicroarcula sp. S1AR25-4]
MTERSLSPGDVVIDREQADPDEAVVVNTPPVASKDWHVQGHDTTVARDNPNYPADETVAIVVYRDTLRRCRPKYAGYQHLELAQLDADDVSYYAFPQSRLERVDTIDPTTVALDAIDAAPYHSRNFDVEANRAFVDGIRQRGYPRPIPVVRDVDDGYEIVNGHKRVWASHIAGLDRIRAHVIHIDDWDAAQRFAAHHLDGSYSLDEGRVALRRLRERWGPQVNALDIDDRYLSDRQEHSTPA